MAPRAVRGADALVIRALTRLAGGDALGALATWRGALERAPTPALVARARPAFARLEGAGPRDGAPPPSPPEEPASPAWACAWAGDLDEARRLAEASPSDAATLGLLGVLDVLARRPESALERLDRALAHGGGEHLVLHRVRALTHLERFDEARAALAALRDGESFARRLLIALVHVRSGKHLPAFHAWHRRVVADETALNGFFTQGLPALVGRPALARAFASPEAFAACLEGVLDRLAGNLGPSPTLAETAADGSRRFVRLALPPTARDQAAGVLHDLPHVGAAATEAAFAALIASHPRSIHAHTYRGELLLWLGRYDEAWRAFVAAHRIEPARWADIGMLATLVLRGCHRAAHLMAVRTERGFTPIPGSTLPVYRGALRRRTGDLTGAVSDLRDAVTAKPSRVGARIELCLALRAAGMRAEAVEHAAQIARDAAPILVHAADARALDWRAQPAVLVSDEVLEEALVSMRGNRSSAVVTWIGADGTLRILERRDALEREARRLLADVA